MSVRKQTKFSQNQLISPTPTPLSDTLRHLFTDVWKEWAWSFQCLWTTFPVTFPVICVALPGGACIFWCKHARQHDQRVDMIIVGSDVLHVILKCLEQQGQEHQEFLIFLEHNVTLAQGKTKNLNYISYNELYSKYQCIINIQVYLLLPLKINLCTLNVFRNMHS